MRYDQESALAKVVSDVKRHHGDKIHIMPEIRPKNDSKSAGLVERANQTVEAQTRTMLSALEERTGGPINPSDPSFPGWCCMQALC